jgi:hypothetical protein
MDLIGGRDWEATGHVVRCLGVSICLPVVLISCGTLALGYTLVRKALIDVFWKDGRNSVSLKIFAGLERASTDMLGHSFRRKLL